jgi:phosphopantothenoylcysteine decarboxylase/phosphopantothenate--cysteine ligase
MCHVMSIRGKKILITAGPTWVRIDDVRVISNIASGESGIILAKKLQGLGARVTLALGPIDVPRLNKAIRIIRFRFFEDLKKLVIRQLKTRKYDALIHSAAVSDYRPKASYKGKIPSGARKLSLALRPTEKIINLLKRADPSLFLVGFKFEPRLGKDALLKEARSLTRSAHLDLAVANTLNKNKYRAYILNHAGAYGPLDHKKKMAQVLVSLIAKML